jgi:hypothetical protein
VQFGREFFELLEPAAALFEEYINDEDETRSAQTFAPLLNVPLSEQDIAIPSTSAIEYVKL